MNKMRNWVVGLTLVSLLAVGVVAIAGNGFGSSGDWEARQATGACDLAQQDADGDGTPNCEDEDFVRTKEMKGSGGSRMGGGTRGGCK